MPQTELFRPAPGSLPERAHIPDRYKWDLTDICASWAEWTANFRELESAIDAFKGFEGTLGQGGARLLEVFRLSDRIGALSYRVWYFASLQYDEDQRDNTLNARRQQVQILFAKQAQASS